MKNAGSLNASNPAPCCGVPPCSHDFCSSCLEPICEGQKHACKCEGCGGSHPYRFCGAPDADEPTPEALDLCAKCGGLAIGDTELCSAHTQK